MHDKLTLDFYAREAPVYVSSGLKGGSRHMAGFLERLHPNSRILELGCGGGKDARQMIDAGHDVVVTDGTPEIAAKARAFLNHPVQVLRFEDLSEVNAYDAIWANASLLHVPRSDLPDVLGKVLTALKPDGLHHATYKAGGQEGRDRHERYFNYLSSEQAVDMYEQSGDWSILSVTEYTGGGYDKGVKSPWIAVLAKKRDS